MKLFALLLAMQFIASCDTATSEQAGSAAGVGVAQGYPPAGFNQMLRAPLSAADGLEVILSDVVIPADTVLPYHYHPGEVYVYLIEGSTIYMQAEKPDRIINVGDAYVVPPGVLHATRGGPDGGRAVVLRVHVKGEEERVFAD